MSDPGIGADEIVNFPVPRRYLPVVIRALADAMDDGVPAPPVPTPHSASYGGWTREEIRQLKREVQNPTVLALLNLTAERAGEWVSLSEVQEKAGRTRFEARGDLAGFTQLVKRHFSATKPEGTWPVMFDWRPSPDRETRAVYSMPPDIASWWKSVA